MKNNDEIIAFLTSDVIKETNKPVARDGYKEGYLTKRGKNFGGWKTRFFVLQGPHLEYYESVRDRVRRRWTTTLTRVLLSVGANTLELLLLLVLRLVGNTGQQIDANPRKKGSTGTPF